MVDSFVNSMDIFPSFKSFQEPKDDQGAFTIDKKDLEEMKKPVPIINSTISTEITKKSKSNSSAQCDICSVPISSQIVYDTHIKGRKHQTQLTKLLSKNPEYKPLTYDELCSKKPEAINVNDESQKSEPIVNEPSPLIPTKKLNCNICNVSCNSQQMYDNHVAGKKHQTKVKLSILTNPAPPRNVPDNNPSSSNYCDICSLKLNTEDELTEHLAHSRHLTRVKEAETCAKEASEMNINFDDYKISITDNEKDSFNYQCTPCSKKFRNKMQVIDHLKSASHNRISNPASNQRPSRKSNSDNRQPTRGGVSRGGLSTRGHSYPAHRGSNKPTGKTRPYQPQRSSWNQSSDQPPMPPNNIFGAFDPNNNYSSVKRPVDYEEIPQGYDGFYPKRNRTYNEEADNSQNYYANYYPPPNNDPYSSQNMDYNNQPSISQPPWQYPTEPYYDPQQYSNPMNQMYYPSNQPPLPNYEQPPLPNYPPPSSYSQTSSYQNLTEDPENNFYPNSFRH